MYVLFYLVIFAIGCIFYFIPTIVAIGEKHEHIAGIIILNLFLGWTLLGWVIALIWAVTHVRNAEVE